MIILGISENPFLQLVETIHSPLFWFMVLALLTLLGLFYFYYVRGNNSWGIAEKYLSAYLEQRGYHLLEAQQEIPKVPFSNEADAVLNNSSITHSLYWRIMALTPEQHKKELWAKIFYHNHNIVTVAWLPNINGHSVVL